MPRCPFYSWRRLHLELVRAFTLRVALLPRNSIPAPYRNKTSALGRVFLRGSDTARALLHLCSLHRHCVQVGATELQHHRHERQRLEGPFVAPLRSAVTAARLHPNHEAAARRHGKFLRMAASPANGFQNPAEPERGIVLPRSSIARKMARIVLLFSCSLLSICPS